MEVNSFQVENSKQDGVGIICVLSQDSTKRWLLCDGECN